MERRRRQSVGSDRLLQPELDLLPRLARSRYCAFVEAREALRVRGGVTEARQGNQNYESEK